MPRAEQDRDSEIGTRSIRLPNYIWEALDKDAQRCRRSPVRQLEAILVRYYELESNIEVDEEALNKTAATVSPHLRRAKASK